MHQLYVTSQPVTILFGLGLSVVGLYLFKHRLDFMHNTGVCIGEVIEVKPLPRHRHQVYLRYYALVRFQTNHGKTYVFAAYPPATSAVVAGPEFAVGQLVPVRYKLNKPKEARINVVGPFWLDGALMVAAGVAIVLWGLVPTVTLLWQMAHAP